MLEWSNPFVVGYLPQIITSVDTRSAIEQIKANYVGGWNPFEGFTLVKNKNGSYQLEYPGDPPMKELSRTQLRDEVIVLFQYDWVAIIHGTDYRVARID